jgi:hypothetical protein
VRLLSKLIDLTGTIRHSGGSRARSEVFQRHPEGKGTALDTGLRRYDVKKFFHMKSLTLDTRFNLIITILRLGTY